MRSKKLGGIDRQEEELLHRPGLRLPDRFGGKGFAYSAMSRVSVNDERAEESTGSEEF